ncbi:MAG: hypothetical protein JW883_09390 [Deltaproteobacteria bacterium]|nr:hypothetical protein [Deltaproteobacteria bacterium]
MGYSVSEEALKRTNKCAKNFSCLSGKMVGLCEVERFFSLQIVLVNKVNKDSCDYARLVDDYWFCTCPVRAELNKRYGI